MGKDNGILAQLKKRLRDHNYTSAKLHNMIDAASGDSEFERGVRLGSEIGRLEMEYIKDGNEVSKEIDAIQKESETK